MLSVPQSKCCSQTFEQCGDSQLFVQVNRGTGLVIMDQSGGSEAVAIARFIRQLSRRKVYVLEVHSFHDIRTLFIRTILM